MLPPGRNLSHPFVSLLVSAAFCPEVKIRCWCGWRWELQAGKPPGFKPCPEPCAEVGELCPSSSWGWNSSGKKNLCQGIISCCGLGFFHLLWKSDYMLEEIDFFFFFFMDISKLMKLWCKYSCAALAMLGLCFCVTEIAVPGVGWCCGAPILM